MHHWVTSKRKGVRPIWMPEEIHQQLMQKTKEDEFKKKSEQAKKNKRGGSLEGVVEPGHCQGSISTAEYARRMAAKNGGVLPKAADIYLETHSKERQPGQGKQLIGSKSKQIMDNYNKKLDDYREKGVNKDPNEVYFETVGGRKKGLIPGLGTSGDLLYKKSSTRTSSSSSVYTPSMLSQLSTTVEQYQQQLADQVAEFQRQKNEWETYRLQTEKEREEAKKYMEEMKTTMEEYSQMMTQCGTFPFTQPRDPRDPSGGGSEFPCST
ncbi:uncharacterized protein LOC104886459 [Beta vulgaris subsp. vulgaris]|uniref:uncharacterized protein LOC104886459 n=1 Tax=Beta vulgaris subsp. vulgaris TaxID=3555 RepID=UPI00254802F2|nr:uncharacterized protein LOC104886459 [Beta vulgaris subsp. vulgaris]